MTVMDQSPISPFIRPEDVVPAKYADQLELVITDDPCSADWDQAAEIEAQVFIDSGYVKSREELTEEYAPYVDTSAMIGLKMRRSGEMIGSSRVTDAHPQNGLKTFSDIAVGRLELDDAGRKALEDVSIARTMEIGTIALKEQYRGVRSAGFVGLLYAAHFVRATNNEQSHVIASFDAHYFNGFGRKYNFAKAVGPAVQYMGSLTVPVLMEVNKATLNQFTGKMT